MYRTTMYSNVNVTNNYNKNFKQKTDFQVDGANLINHFQFLKENRFIIFVSKHAKINILFHPIDFFSLSNINIWVLFIKSTILPTITTVNGKFWSLKQDVYLMRKYYCKLSDSLKFTRELILGNGQFTSRWKWTYRCMTCSNEKSLLNNVRRGLK